MANPKISMPASVSIMFDIVLGPEGTVKEMNLKQDWASYFASLGMVAQAITQTGSTSARPTSTTIGRFEGQPFFDRTLGFPIFLKHASSNVWVDAQGNVV